MTLQTKTPNAIVPFSTSYHITFPELTITVAPGLGVPFHFPKSEYSIKPGYQVLGFETVIDAVDFARANRDFFRDEEIEMIIGEVWGAGLEGKPYAFIVTRESFYAGSVLPGLLCVNDDKELEYVMSGSGVDLGMLVEDFRIRCLSAYNDWLVLMGRREEAKNEEEEASELC